MTQHAHLSLDLARNLIERASITPLDLGCQNLMCERLEAIGFEIVPLAFGEADERVENFWAIRRGQSESAKTLAFAGHTDVVPTGPIEQWNTDPFEAVSKDGYLYGRGAADMKASLAAMVVACENFVASGGEHQNNIAFLITSDEEGPATYGTVKVVEWLAETTNQPLEWCIVGEPSSQTNCGDMVKNGRRGSLNAHITFHGKQGHIAYPHLADNPIHHAMKGLDALCAVEWDQGNDFFPPTSMQISNIQSGTGATNVIPGELKARFNFRYSTEVTADELQSQVHALLDEQQLNYSIDWQLSGEPFLTEPGELLDAVVSSIADKANIQPEISTTGGTSDGRFIAKLGTQVVELGPCNKTIHQVNECVKEDDVVLLTDIYQSILEKIIR